MKMLKCLLAGAALSVSGASFAVGAIAVDDQVGDRDPGYGFSLGHPDKESARRAAMRQCRDAGNRNCKFMVWFETCGAYASSRRYYGVGWGATASNAQGMAMKNCSHRNCTIKVARCER